MAKTNLDKGGAFATSRRGGVDAWEIAFIDQRRRQRVSDFAIAGMLGRPVSSISAVPRACELVALEPPAANPRPVVTASTAITLPPPRKPAVTKSPRCRTMPPRVRVLVAEIAARHQLTTWDLVGRNQSARYALARHEAFAMIREYRESSGKSQYSLPLIGSWFGGRDHTTVRTAIINYLASMAQAQSVPA